MAEVQKDKGVVVVAIGGGTANVHDLEPMASEPKVNHWTNLESFESLTKLS